MIVVQLDLVCIIGTMNTTEYMSELEAFIFTAATIDAGAKPASKAEMLSAIDNVMQRCRADWHACVDAGERARCAAGIRRAVAELRAIIPNKRAGLDLWMRRERAFDAAASLLAKAMV